MYDEMLNNFMIIILGISNLCDNYINETSKLNPKI